MSTAGRMPRNAVGVAPRRRGPAGRLVFDASDLRSRTWPSRSRVRSRILAPAGVDLRRHSSCSRMPPAKFAELHRQRAGDAAQTTSTTAEINWSCNPDFLVMNGSAGGGRSARRASLTCGRARSASVGCPVMQGAAAKDPVLDAATREGARADVACGAFPVVRAAVASPNPQGKSRRGWRFAHREEVNAIAPDARVDRAGKGGNHRAPFQPRPIP